MSEILDSLFDSLKVQLAADDMAVRMKALHASRSLTLSERFSLVAIASADPYARIRYDAVKQRYK